MAILRKNIFIVNLLLFLFVGLPVQLSQACGPGDYRFKGYDFLRTDLARNDSNFAPFLLRFENLYEVLDTVQERGNLEEWQEIFCGIVTLPDLRKVIYESSVAELESLYTSVRSKNLPLDFRFAKNSFARYLQRNKCVETARYLVFAKQCEPHVVKSDDWETVKRDEEAMDLLIKKGLRDFRKTKSNYIRLRYAYQIIRMAHYAGQYERTLALYEDLMPKTDPVVPLAEIGGSIIQYWIEGHRAGAMQALGQRIEAAYLYTQIFLHCPSKRSSAYLSFRIRTDEEWRQCWLLCQNDEERAALYAIRATADDAKAVEEMGEIYKIIPESKMLELLLMKEMKKVERDFLGLEFNDQRKNNRILYGVPRKDAGRYLIQLQELVIKAVEEKRVANLPLWELALGYLEYLSGDFYAAEKSFDRLEFDKKQQPVLHEQLELFRLILDIVNTKEMTREKEDDIYRLITDNPLYKKYHDLPDFLNDRLSALYAANNRPGMAFRFHHNLRELYASPQLDVIDDLLEVCDRENRSLLEGMIVIDKKGDNIRSRILDIKGSYLLSQDEPEPAMEVLRLIPPVEWDNFQCNPFIERLNDCVFCPLPDSIEYYNKIELIERLFELEYEARANFRTGATHLYELGIAYYNISYFGQAWEVMDGYRSGANWYYQKNNIYPLYWASNGNRENVDLSLAMSYFERAIELSSDTELAARAAFMAAKCEQKQYFFSPDCDYNIFSNEIPQLPPDYQRYFTLLRDNYAGTDFYQEAIRECLYFRAFARE